MTNEEAQRYLQLQADAEHQLDARIDRVADRNWRMADQTINGTTRSFLTEAALIQRLPFPQAESTNDGRTSEQTADAGA